MKSTWRAGDRKNWTHFHWTIVRRGLYHQSLDKEVPVHQKTDKIPYIPEWQIHRWILYHAAIPMLLHQAYVSYTGKSVHAVAVALFYTICFSLIGNHQLIVMRRMGHRYGFLDGDKHQRDDVPDHSVTKTLISLIATISLRAIMTTILTYDSSQGPFQLNWLALPVEIGLYGITLDFFFYWYHRVMHDVDFFWRFHRRHHLTKHPSPLLTLYADVEQEFFDIVGIPLVTFFAMRFMGLPMGFSEWWICHNYVIWTELCGHSGLRVHIHTPSTVTWLLKYFDCELVCEDHDLHHRSGWKKSHNYGKQTRLWDRIFGTCHDRIESKADNVDYENPGEWPVFL